MTWELDVASGPWTPPQAHGDIISSDITCWLLHLNRKLAVHKIRLFKPPFLAYSSFAYINVQSILVVSRSFGTLSLLSSELQNSPLSLHLTRCVARMLAGDARHPPPSVSLVVFRCFLSTFVCLQCFQYSCSNNFVQVRSPSQIKRLQWLVKVLSRPLEPCKGVSCWCSKCIP